MPDKGYPSSTEYALRGRVRLGRSRGNTLDNHKKRVTVASRPRSSRNARLMPQFGASVGRTNAPRPPDQCQKKYAGCEGEVMVSIRHPETPHIYIRMCASCANVDFTRRNREHK